MKTLDRYIVRQFLMNFVILFAVVMSLFVVVDLIVDLDEFLTAGHERTARFGSFWIATVYSVFDYYGPIVFLLYVFFSGLLVVAAMGFTFSALGRTGELVAMVTGGISMYRIAAPVVLTGILLNAAALPIQEYVIPPLADKLARGKAQARLDWVETYSIKYAPDGKGSLFSAAAFDGARGVMTELSILRRDDRGQAVERISAESARWNAGRQGWDLAGGSVIHREGDKTGLDSPGTGGARRIDFFGSDLSPQVLLARRATIYPRLLSLAELMRMAQNPAADSDTIRRIMHSRFSLLVVNVLILVMTLPFYLTREPVNVMAQAVRSIGICMGAWGVGLVILQAAGGVNPVTAAWLPVVVYLPLSAYLLQTIKT